MYAFSIPLSQVYSLLVRPPRIGWWSGSVVVNARGGETHPALFFHDAECKVPLSLFLADYRVLNYSRRNVPLLRWVVNVVVQSETFDPFGAHGDPFWGGDEVLRWLRKYATIQRSAVEAQLYLVDPSSQDLLSLTPSPSTTPPHHDAPMDPLTSRLKEVRWGLLEKFAKVTAFGRRTVSDVMEQPLVKDHVLPRLPPQVRDIVKSKEGQRYAGEYDSAREYLARWAAGVAEEADRQRNRRGEEVGIWGTRHSGWEEMSELGGFEVLSVYLRGGGADGGRLLRRCVWNGRKSWMKRCGISSLIILDVSRYLPPKSKRRFSMGYAPLPSLFYSTNWIVGR